MHSNGQQPAAVTEVIQGQNLYKLLNYYLYIYILKNEMSKLLLFITNYNYTSIKLKL